MNNINNSKDETKMILKSLTYCSNCGEKIVGELFDPENIMKFQPVSATRMICTDVEACQKRLHTRLRNKDYRFPK